MKPRWRIGRWVALSLVLVAASAAGWAAEVKTWGSNDRGQLGHTTPLTTSPAIVPDLSGVLAISAGERCTLALMSGGGVQAWGYNESGQLGMGDTADRLVPAAIPDLTGVQAISAGHLHTLALMNDRTVKAWGNNDGGKLGLGDMTTRLSPETIPGLSNVQAVAAGGYFSMALMDDGTVKAWGYNFYGNLGMGDRTERLVPTDIPGLSNVQAIVAGHFHALALMSNGTVKAWGGNNAGQLGLGDTSERLSPTDVPGLSNVQAVAGRLYHALALMSNGTVKAWGNNADGQLGLGDTTTRLSPVAIPGLADVLAVVGGGYHALALMSNGTVKACGANGNGQLGLEDIRYLSPTLIPGLSNVQALAGGGFHSVALGSFGDVRFDSPTQTVAEPAGCVTVSVRRVGRSAGAASVQYATANGTATAGVDYAAATGTLDWAGGDLSTRTVAIAILDNTAYEPDRTFAVTLSGATGAEYGWPSSAIVTIVSDDPLPAPAVRPATNGTFDAFWANWQAVDGAVYYGLDVAPTPDFSTVLDGYSNRLVWTETTCHVTGLQARTPYYYRVRAENYTDRSGDSATQTVTAAALGMSATSLVYAATLGGADPAPQTLLLTNQGNRGLAFTAAVAYAAGGSGWWSAVPATGTLAGGAAALLVGAVQAAGLSAGVYGATLTLEAPDATNCPRTLAIMLTLHKAQPTVTRWPAASPIVYGQRLSNAVLSGGSATPAGRFAFTAPATAPVAGTALHGVAFTPLDTGNYSTVTGTVPVTVAKAAQTIAFPSIPDQVTTSVVTLAATASSGLPAAFSRVSGPGTITGGNTLSFTGTGTVTVAANQAGNANWKAAATVQRTVKVNPARPMVAGLLKDFDGDGRADPATYDERSGTWRVKLSTAGYMTFNFAALLGGPGWQAAAADYDGDGLADPAVYRDTTGNWKVMPSGSGYALLARAAFLGAAGWAPVSEDFDGDGKADYGVYQETTGTWKIKLSSGGYFLLTLTSFLGGPGKTALAGDFDGDGLADPAVYTRADGTWQVRMSSSGYVAVTVPRLLGGTGWDAVPGDYDGDGLADPAVRKADGSLWRILQSGSGYAATDLRLGL